MRLAPCHYTFQVFVHEDKLSGVLTQRSCDFPIGVPYNIAFYSGLIYMLAQQTGYRPYEFVHHAVDSHIYINQIEAVEEYLNRPEISCPKLNLRKASSITEYSVDDFDIQDYNPGLPIKIPVAV
jgi:thymidylate synthase